MQPQQTLGLHDEFHKKLQAAQILGLETDDQYIKIDEEYFQKFQIKGKDGSVIASLTSPINKENILKNFEEIKANLQKNVDEIQKKIDAINNLDR